MFVQFRSISFNFVRFRSVVWFSLGSVVWFSFHGYKEPCQFNHSTLYIQSRTMIPAYAKSQFWTSKSVGWPQGHWFSWFGNRTTLNETERNRTKSNETELCQHLPPKTGQNDWLDDRVIFASTPMTVTVHGDVPSSSSRRDRSLNSLPEAWTKLTKSNEIERKWPFV